MSNANCKDNLINDLPHLSIDGLIIRTLGCKIS
jgi:hypothetical protein